MGKRYILAANWKMNLSFGEAIRFAQKHSDELVELCHGNTDLILIPSFVSLYTLSTVFNSTPISIGAQNCSNHSKGSFTGQIPAQSLNEVGCKYCIIGHSEVKTHLYEYEKDIIEKFIHLIDFDISPIICFGENKEEHSSGQTLSTVKKQLEGIFNIISSGTIKIPEYLQIYLAYEPIWSIGTGNIPEREHLDRVFAYLKSELQKLPSNINWKLLYGGSVNKDNIASFKNLGDIDGFLVGGASTKFDNLKEMMNKLQ